MMQVGDVVCLKGANKQMTVIESYGESCKVTWFDENGELQHAIFDQKVLRKVEEKE